MKKMGQEAVDAYEADGFVVLPRFVPREMAAEIEEEMITLIRAHPPSARPDEKIYAAGEAIVQVEAKEDGRAVLPEDAISKIFSVHRQGAGHKIATWPLLVEAIGALIGENIDCFQSQFIFKNPGAWGQPWHQDSYYFRFNRQPQLGMWLAVSEATLENGCLNVLPGSHREPIQPHEPDSREGANLGYLEIRDHDMSGAVPVLMEPGDVLLFHSFLMHRSEDNRADKSRMALVHHYAPAGTALLEGEQNPIVDFMPVSRTTD